MPDNSSFASLDASSHQQYWPHPLAEVPLRRQLRRLGLAAAGAVLLIGAAVLAYLRWSFAEHMTAAVFLVLAGAAAICAGLLLGAGLLAGRLIARRVAELRAVVSQRHKEVQDFANRLRRGDRVQPRTPQPPALDSDQWQMLAHDVERLRHTATLALTEAPVIKSATMDHRVGVFVNLARRLQSLIHREIQLLDELENQVEDPELLKGLFSVDHLATRIRRHAENLAVLGGEVSRRQWSQPVNLYEVVRSAVAEVERYARVKLVRPIEGTVQGHAVADVVHLVAELVENATNFSNPQTQVLVRAEPVTAGLAVEVEDRGLGIPLEEQQQINRMLAHPEQIDLDELLRDGRIGLFVVASLAHRHGIAVALRTSIYGGVQAIVVLPQALLGEAAQPAPAAVGQSAQSGGQPGGQLSARPAASQASPPHAPPPHAPPPHAPPPSAPAHLQAAAQPVPQQVQVPEPAASPSPRPSNNPVGGPSSNPPETFPQPAGATKAAPVTAPQAATAAPPVGPSPAPGYGHGMSQYDHGVSQYGVSQHGVSQHGMSQYGQGASQSGYGPEGSSERHPPERSSQEWHTADTGPLPAMAGDSQQGDPRPELPRRRRQSHLAPELRDSAPQPPREAADDLDPGLMSSFQRGYQRGTSAGDLPAAGEQPRSTTTSH